MDSSNNRNLIRGPEVDSLHAFASFFVCRTRNILAKKRTTKQMSSSHLCSTLLYSEHANLSPIGAFSSLSTHFFWTSYRKPQFLQSTPPWGSSGSLFLVKKWLRMWGLILAIQENTSLVLVGVFTWPHFFLSMSTGPRKRNLIFADQENTN